MHCAGLVMITLTANYAEMEREMNKLNVHALSLLIILIFIIGCNSGTKTVIALKENNWTINGNITNPNTLAEGLLINVRMVNSIFTDDSKPGFSPEINTNNFIESIKLYKQQGVTAFTLNLQGGMPGYEGAVNSAFDKNGDLDPDYMKRVDKVIRACSENEMAVILGCFYQRQDQILQDADAVKNAVANVCKWISDSHHKNILLEIANEYPHSGYNHDIIKTVKGQLELIDVVRKNSNELLVSTSGLGNGRMNPQLAKECDFILIHFNNTPADTIPARIKALQVFDKPLVCNEDDKIGIDAVNALRACVENKCSWGYMNLELNQHYPFEFHGKKDDEMLYNAIADFTRQPLVFNTTDPDIVDLENAVLKTMDALRPTSGALIISRGPEILYEKYFTGSEPQKPESEIDKNSMWPLFSCTKSYISALMLSMMKDSLIKLDEPVGLFLPAFKSDGNGPFSRKSVTLRHLASHTSGVFLPDAEMQDGRIVLIPPIDLYRIEIRENPGDVFLYSTLGMHILERALEAAAGKDLEVLLNERILGPLNTKNTKYIYEYTNELPLLPCIAGDFSETAQHFALIAPGYRCSSGLYTTAREFNRFGQLMTSNGTFEGHHYFNAHDKSEIWKYHGTRDSDGGRYGLLWWLFEKEGGFVMSGAGNVVNAVIPESNIVVTHMRNHIGSHPGPYNYYENKKLLVQFGKMLE